MDGVIEAVPALEVGVLPSHEDVLVAHVMGSLIDDPGPVLHPDGVAAADVGADLRAVTAAFVVMTLEVLVLIEEDLQAWLCIRPIHLPAEKTLPLQLLPLATLYKSANTITFKLLKGYSIWLKFWSFSYSFIAIIISNDNNIITKILAEIWEFCNSATSKSDRSRNSRSQTIRQAVKMPTVYLNHFIWKGKQKLVHLKCR